MPIKRESALVPCRYYNWLLSKRGEVWQADGRSNDVDAGRHSLGTHNEDEARDIVHELDEEMAMKLGLIERKVPVTRSGLTVLQAIEIFRAHKKRPVPVGGVEPQTLERYDRILNKFKSFTEARRERFVTEVCLEMFDDYVSMLEDKDFALTTIVTEMVLLKSLHQFCIDQKLLDPRFGFRYQLRRPGGSLTYCPSADEVDEILSVLKNEPSLTWLYRVVEVLSKTGLRFGEARDLEWRDIDKDFKYLKVRDESYLTNAGGGEVRKTKTRKSRKIPIHRDLAVVLKTFQKQSGRILAGPRGGKLRNDIFGDTLRANVIPMVIEACGGTDVLRLTAHGFRHYFVSRCANRGVPQFSVMSWLGHSTPRMSNYYYHQNDAASLEHMRQLEAAEDSDQRDQNQ